jgi:hypothetical protein
MLLNSGCKKTLFSSVFDKKTSKTRLAIPIAIGIENKVFTGRK